MKTEFIVLKEAPLTNNCPVCYANDGMVLSFRQKRLKSKFLIKTNGALIEGISCKKCESDIFPGQWTKDIERVYDYHKKTIEPKSGSIHFTKLFYILFVLIMLTLGIGYLYLYNPEILGIIN